MREEAGRPASRDPFSGRIDAAARHLNAGRSEDALELYQEVLAAAPAHPLAIAGLAQLYLLTHQADRGFAVLAEAAATYPAHPIILAGLAHAHSSQGRHEEALICIERVLELAGGEGRYHAQHGEILVRLGRARDAMAAFRTSLSLAPDNAVTWLNLGILDAGVGDSEAAEACFQRALANDPGLAEADHNLALLFEARGAIEEALRHAEAAYVSSPSHGDFLAAYARLSLANGRDEQGRRLLRRGLALSPHDVELLEMAARLSIEAGEGDAAFRPLSLALRRKPDDVEAILALARCFSKAGRLVDALALADEARKAQPDHAAAGAIQRRLRFALGRFEEAGDTSATWPSLVFAGVNVEEALLLARFLTGLDGEYPTTPVLCERETGELLAHVAGLDVFEAAMPPAKAASLSDLLSAVPVGWLKAEWAPYLRPEPGALARWQAAIGEFTGPRIGLSWRRDGGDPSLSFLVEALRELGTPISLAAGEDRATLRNAPGVIDAGRHFSNYADLVAAIAALDLVVCGDGVVAHIAGALGKPGIVLVPAELPWCWAHREGQSHWYPSLTVLPIPAASKERADLSAQLREAVTSRLSLSAMAVLPFDQTRKR